MQQCSRCKKNRGSEYFYPNSAWCKRCIDKKRGKKRDLAVEVSDKLLREQAAICAVIDAYQQNGESYVYLIEHGDTYKIGFSTSVSRRVRSFNTAHSKPVRVLAVAPGGRDEEAALHEAFKHCRIAREWYSRRLEVLWTFRDLPGAMLFQRGHVTTEAPSAAASLTL